MKTDIQTMQMINKSINHILKAEEESKGVYRLTLITGEEYLINELELNIIKDRCDNINMDFDIYQLDGEITHAIS